MILVLSRQHLAMMAFGCQHKHMILVEVVLSRQHLTIMAFGCQHKHMIMNHDPCPLPQHKLLATLNNDGIWLSSQTYDPCSLLATLNNDGIWLSSQTYDPCSLLATLNSHGIGCQHKHLYDLVPKGAHARGYALQLKIKHCWKLFLFKMLCCVLAWKWWMNEYIVQIISATRLWLISRYSHHTLKKRRKMTAKNGHPCTELFLSLCLQTNRKHMENQSLICTRKTSFYTDNITLTLTIVVFSISWSRMFALYVRQRCCKLWTTEKRQDRFGITGNVACVPIHAFALHSDTRFFSSEVLHEIWRIFPRSFDIVVISDVPTR